MARESEVHESTASVPFGAALRFWLKLGFISFGGPAGQISIMHRELVDERRWISEKRFLHALNYCMLLPGPEAQQLATYLGWLMHRSWGGILAGTLFVLPSLITLIAISYLYVAFGERPLVEALFLGVKPAVTALVIHAGIRLGSRVLTSPLLISLAIVSFVAASLLKLPFPLIVLGAGAIGFFARHWDPMLNRVKPHQEGGPRSESLSALIGDTTPPPPHARFSRQKLIRTIIAGVGIWMVSMLALTSLAPDARVLQEMGFFFTRAALLTFGGAYAVLPYVHDAAVHQYGWVTSAQMIDGLALGETTPGPLIMIVAFVGFLGAFQHAIFGPDATLLAGCAGALVATWFTFLPSFIFILAGAPFVESTRGDLKLTAPLTAISAAIVGVIGGLAFFFIGHVLWPKGFTAPLNVPAAALLTISLIMLVVWKQSVMRVLVASALLGIAGHYGGVW